MIIDIPKQHQTLGSVLSLGLTDDGVSGMFAPRGGCGEETMSLDWTLRQRSLAECSSSEISELSVQETSPAVHSSALRENLEE